MSEIEKILQWVDECCELEDLGDIGGVPDTSAARAELGKLKGLEA